MRIFICIIIGIALFDLLMLFWSLIEVWRSRFIRDPWRREGQILLPPSDMPRATVILVHGFIDSPLGVKPLASKLQQEGFRVVVPMMPFQAAKCWAFTRGTFTASNYITWLKEVIENESRNGFEKPFLVGFSMGGTLATIAAAQNRVAGTILLAPYYGLRFGTELLGKAARWVRWIIPVLPSNIGKPINDPEGRRHYRPGSLLISVGAFYQLELLRRRAVASVSDIRTPVTVFAAPKDRVAAYGSAEKVWQDHPRVKWHVQPKANHVLCYDYDAGWMLKEAVRFLKTKCYKMGTNM